jgi:hypothetical protein
MKAIDGGRSSAISELSQKDVRAQEQKDITVATNERPGLVHSGSFRRKLSRLKNLFGLRDAQVFCPFANERVLAC